MKPQWDDLGSQYAGSGVVIGDADCTVETELCQRFNVQGYPTIKYFTDTTPDEGEDYNGGRDAESLKKFTEDTLEPKCDAVNDPTTCTEKEQKYITKQTGKSTEDLQKQVLRLEGMAGSSMKPELKAWIMQRIRILKQLAPAEAAEDEVKEEL